MSLDGCIIYGHAWSRVPDDAWSRMTFEQLKEKTAVIHMLCDCITEGLTME